MGELGTRNWGYGSRNNPPHHRALIPYSLFAFLIPPFSTGHERCAVTVEGVARTTCGDPRRSRPFLLPISSFLPPDHTPRYRLREQLGARHAFCPIFTSNRVTGGPVP